jgi:hypothetical protein
LSTTLRERRTLHATEGSPSWIRDPIGSGSLLD